MNLTYTVMNKNWELTLSFYPGILFGIRTYPEEKYNQKKL